MPKINILLLAGGDGSEHEISLVSAKFLKEQLLTEDFNVLEVIIHKNYWETADGVKCQLNHDRTLSTASSSTKIDYVVPCIHGVPGETGDIQSYLEILGIPYLGCPPEGSRLCFNKVSTKLWFSGVGIPNTPFIFLDENSQENLEKAHEFFKQYKSVFVKAASQGSSVGCYKVVDENTLDSFINKAFEYSQDVLIEQAVKPRELETAVYEYQGKLIVTPPGEIVTPSNDFYTFEEKYNSTSQTHTEVEAAIDAETKEKIMSYAKKAFKVLKLKDLSRIDFFLVNDKDILLNEINTFPGMTPISMFPKMLEHHGENMKDFLKDRVLSAIGK